MPSDGAMFIYIFIKSCPPQKERKLIFNRENYFRSYVVMSLGMSMEVY